MVGTEGARTDKVGTPTQTVAFLGNDVQRAQAVPGLRNAILRLLQASGIKDSVRVGLSFPKPNDQLSAGLVVRRPLDDGIECSWSHSQDGRAIRLLAKLYMPQKLDDSQDFFAKLIAAQRNLLHGPAQESLFSELQRRAEITASGLVRYAKMSEVLFEVFGLNTNDAKAYLHKLVNAGDLIDTEREMYRLGEAWSRFKPVQATAANDSRSGEERQEDVVAPAPAEDNRPLAEQILAYREKYELTGGAFAQLVGTTPATLKKVMDGSVEVRESTIERIKSTLKTEPRSTKKHEVTFDPTTEQLIQVVISQVMNLQQVDELISNIIGRMKMLPAEAEHMAQTLLRNHLVTLDDATRLKELLELRDWFKKDSRLK
jgi:DNA-binding transcriptional regulator YiaG